MPLKAQSLEDQCLEGIIKTFLKAQHDFFKLILNTSTETSFFYYYLVSVVYKELTCRG